jgi:hypothetical protein
MTDGGKPRLPRFLPFQVEIPVAEPAPFPAKGREFQETGHVREIGSGGATDQTARGLGTARRSCGEQGR